MNPRKMELVSATRVDKGQSSGPDTERKPDTSKRRTAARRTPPLAYALQLERAVLWKGRLGKRSEKVALEIMDGAWKEEKKLKEVKRPTRAQRLLRQARLCRPTDARTTRAVTFWHVFTNTTWCPAFQQLANLMN